jgi:alkylhydroperoxidase/carboxymuconolactone decarboxylase family protein YurZ
VESCIKRMTVVAPPPPANLPRCAAVMTLAAEAVKAREGLSKGAKDLATLASVLAYRAKVEGAAAGKTEAQVAEAIAADRAAASKAGGADEEELQSCAELAAAE